MCVYDVRNSLQPEVDSCATPQRDIIPLDPSPVIMKASVIWTVALLAWECQALVIPAGGTSRDGLLTDDQFPYHVQLNDAYELFWNFNTTHIIFRTHVKTNGYIGFGISPNGAMANSDVIIGWVKDGQSYFADRHAEGHFLPAQDVHQDWFLLSGTEVGDFTTLTFIRKLVTCDSEDLPILNGTTRVIYSYHPSDPTAGDAIGFHGTGRYGTRSILMLDPPASEENSVKLPDDVITVDFLNRNFSVPGADTYYRCQVYKIPDLGQKHHMIRYEPVIQPGHEQLVHHILLYYCSGNKSDSYVGTSFMCYDQAPKELMGCEHVLVAWAVGGQAFDYPAHVGHSLSSPGDPVLIIMETHYNNPDLRTDFVDNSGMRLYLTKQLRQHDAGIIEAGLAVDMNLVVPPYESSFVMRGYCQSSCVDQGVGDQEIHIFANLLHAHLLGRKLRTRHFRNGVELPPIMEDNSYDFNYQEMRKLKEERTIKKGDSLIVECDYDSTKRTSPTYGGLKTTYEMCLSFLVFYPKTPISRCLSRFEYSGEYAGDKLYGALQTKDWSSPVVRSSFRKNMEDSNILNLCWLNPNPEWIYGVTATPNITQPYQVPDTCGH
ncbi:unnamed protein product [Lymnaea stagnalis]|uniref:DOMON domain-containing protein n=1 Tax=Lymnaea stagnalis TaxID=6523 RepID=A0AAV2I1M5_LYMST